MTAVSNGLQGFWNGRRRDRLIPAGRVRPDPGAVGIRQSRHCDVAAAVALEKSGVTLDVRIKELATGAGVQRNESSVSAARDVV